MGRFSRGWALTRQSWDVLMFGLAVVSATLSQIFRVAVYQFALYGQTAGGFNGPQLQAAFQPHPA